MRPRSAGFGGRFVGRRFVAKGVSFLDLTLKRPLVVHIDEPRPRLRELDLAVSDPAPRRDSASGVSFVGVSHCSMASCSIWRYTASCWAF